MTSILTNFRSCARKVKATNHFEPNRCNWIRYDERNNHWLDTFRLQWDSITQRRPMKRKPWTGIQEIRLAAVERNSASETSFEECRQGDEKGQCKIWTAEDPTELWQGELKIIEFHLKVLKSNHMKNVISQLNRTRQSLSIQSKTLRWICISVNERNEKNHIIDSKRIVG